MTLDTLFSSFPPRVMTGNTMSLIWTFRRVADGRAASVSIFCCGQQFEYTEENAGLISILNR